MLIPPLIELVIIYVAPKNDGAVHGLAGADAFIDFLIQVKPDQWACVSMAITHTCMSSYGAVFFLISHLRLCEC